LSKLFPDYVEYDKAKRRGAAHSGVSKKIEDGVLFLCSKHIEDQVETDDDGEEISRIKDIIVIDDKMKHTRRDGVKCENEVIFTLWDIVKVIYNNHQSKYVRDIIFRKEAIYHKHRYLNPEKFETIDDITLDILLCPCEFDGITLGDLFNFVEKNQDIKDFMGLYSHNRFIDEYHFAASEPISNDDENKDDIIEFIEIYPEVNVDVVDLELWEGSHMHGIGKKSDEDKQKLIDWGHSPDQIPDTTNYAIGYTPMNELVHLPVKLYFDGFFYNNDEPGDTSKYTDFKKNGWTLLDILDTIYYEISFHGSPENTKKVLEELKESVANIDEDDLSEYKSFDELKEELGKDKKSGEKK